ncbi:hypothetical protein [Streptomyces sp. MAR4 CNX-425]|uniref:hypothetical protein n=1 Tax=Streptomyces sp. MAR4 CNX-425 TaxID=3406343 RepID=UPI003B505199
MLLLPLITTAALTLVYRTGMGYPEVLEDGSCFEGWPIFPFGDGPDLPPASRK